jgi:GntR family transcriptional regulator, carbon starvation induced regulator
MEQPALPATAHAEPGHTGETTASMLERTLRRDVVEARLAPGMPLRLKDLALAYGVGVIPLREALSRLTAVGLVVALDQKGFSVAPLSRRDLLDATRARQHIETIALKDAMAFGGVEWEARVLAAHHQLSHTLLYTPARDGMNPEWERAHALFHQALISGCASDYLIRFSDILRDQTARYRHLSLKGAHGGKRNVAMEHQAIVEAILSHDAVTACRLLVDHYQKTADLLLKNQVDAFQSPIQPKARPRGRIKTEAQRVGDE